MNPQATKSASEKRSKAQGDVNPLASLHQYGQAPWLDFLARGFIAQGGLKKLVERDGLTGVTSNPSIFEKAIAGSAEYDASLKAIESEGDFDVMTLYERLAIEDIRAAAKVLRPVFEATEGVDGYVSSSLALSGHEHRGQRSPRRGGPVGGGWAREVMIKVRPPAPGCRRSAKLIGEASTSISVVVLAGCP